MKRISLIDPVQAVPGARFVFDGGGPECADCPVATTCLDLTVGTTYAVTAVRPIHHPCPLTGDEVRIVEVAEVPSRLHLPTKVATEGAVVTFTRPRCIRYECPEFHLCLPRHPEDGLRVKVAEIGEAIGCPIGLSLRRCTASLV